MSDFQVLEKVCAPVVGVSPRHGGADGAHLQHNKAVRVCVGSGAETGAGHGVGDLPLGESRERVVRCSALPGRPGPGSGSCSTGR